MKFVIFFGLYLVCVILNVGGGDTEETFQCVSGIAYQENECNHCWCISDGSLACTLMLCGSDQHSKLRNCTVGSKWKRDCDQCWCVKNKGTICTLKCGEKDSSSPL
ncbi:hypothetical protein ILUMI_09570 [Ignelater luminosus]|uniref:Pacifastin domain-containing protein n=1 Tax=Ignelater luminosus TaxID=2038154 RepID=A0A8K0D3L6_IGNLU|nr:hypothetical protein ILUMI_09570 [Ignelater luminosus]